MAGGVAVPFAEHKSFAAVAWRTVRRNTVAGENSGGVRNVFAMSLHLNSPRLDHGLRFKNNAMRGGYWKICSFVTSIRNYSTPDPATE